VAGIYIHIPFCRQACTYCDFHFSTSLKNVSLLVSSIKKEIILQKDYLQNETIETIYFGGGTPSLLDVNEIKSILDLIYSTQTVVSDAEVTLEANPDDLTLQKSKALLGSGINRLSIGIQSFFENDLRFMNRAHDVSQAISSIENVKNAGFRNISIDLIYGLRNQGESNWKQNVEKALSLDVDHISCYALTVEPQTTLAHMIKNKKALPPDDEITIEEFEYIIDHSAEAGFEHYEISNFARNKKYSRHNTSYWQRKKYLGIGPSAHSYDGVSRQWNISNNQLYIKKLEENIVSFEKEVLTLGNKFNEYILTSLRTMWGINTDYVEKEFGLLYKDLLMIKLQQFVNEELILNEGVNFVLTKKGKFFADWIAGDMFV
jgi:oxygen-independent coproporphyrinogen-3 oxidase